MPKISVVMPTYNRAYVVQNAIRSILDQTYHNFEFIIVDDGSEDGTERVVKSFASPQIVYKKIAHLGIAAARNIGNRLAKGEIIVVQDSDDLSLPDRLEEIVNAFENNPDIVYHGLYLRYYDPYHDALTRNVKPALPFDKDKLIHSQYIPGQVAYRKQCILDTPYDERMSSMDDYQMLLEFALQGYKFKPIFKNLYEYVSQDDSNNIITERQGKRKEDVKILLALLKEKYNLDLHATLTNNLISGEFISEEIV